MVIDVSDRVGDSFALGECPDWANGQDDLLWGHLFSSDRFIVFLSAFLVHYVIRRTR